MTDARPDLVRRLVDVVGAQHVITDRDVLVSVERDWTGRFAGPALLLVRPASTSEVAGVVTACRDAGVAIVTQGGNTGLVGGSVPRPHGPTPVVLSTRRLTDLEPVDVTSAQVTVGAGVTLADLERHAAASGFAYAVDFGARDAATIGGTIATNAGGIHAFAYGMTRDQLVGVEAVLADGSVISRLTGLTKDNTGYDLAGLLAGSEGTLGIVTRARVRLITPAREVATAIVALASVEDALALFALVRRDVAGLRAAELMLRPALDLAAGVIGAGLGEIGGAPVYLLLEAGGDSDPAPVLAAALAEHDGVLATSPPDRRRLWAYRDRITEAIATRGVPHKLDVALPLAELAAFIKAVKSIASQHELYVFGHLGDGNMHVNVVGPGASDASIDDDVLGLVLRHGGSISAEHGIGVAKPEWLARYRTESELAAMRAIKRALDPGSLLNPGVLFPASGR